MAANNEEQIDRTQLPESAPGKLAIRGNQQSTAGISTEIGEESGPLSYQPDPFRWIALVIILAGSFMAGMDSFIVNIAIPSIQRGLGASFAAIQLVVAGYSLTYAVLLITGGRLGDLYGRKKLFMIGIAGFILTSTLCGLAPDPAILIASRLLQGASAALLFPQIMALIQVTFKDNKERDRAFGWYGVTVGLSQASGLLLGGLLLGANLFGLAWRPLFLINVPIGLTALVLAGPFVVEAKRPAVPKLDLGGVGILTLGLALLVFPLVQGRQVGWPWWTFLCLGASVLLLTGFFFYERLVARNGSEPLLNQSLLHNLPFIRGLLMVIAFFATQGAFFLIITFYLQSGLGLPPIVAGFITLPSALGIFVASFAAIPIKSKIGKHVLTCGALTMTAGILVCLAIVALSQTRPDSIELLPVLFLIGFGFGLILSPMVNILLGGIASIHAGAASGMIGTSIQIGLSLGVALIGIVFFGLLGSHANYAVSFSWSLVFIAITLLFTIGLVFSLPETRR